MQWIRSALFDVMLALWTLLLSPAAFALYLTNAEQKTLRRFSLFWAKGVIVLLRRVVGMRFTEVGRSNIIAGPLLIVCNHQSTFETFVLPLLFPDATFVCKIELTRIPVFGWCLKKYPMIIVDRSAGAKALVQLRAQSEAAVRKGMSVVIFPEGTRKSVGEELKFRRGVEYLYKSLAIPVLPIVVNSGLLWGPDQPVKQSGVVTISYLPAIKPGLSANDFIRTAESQMGAEKDRLVEAPKSQARINAFG
jgi:1-acyl-sn-glycerol-3-phosphate acyltransferase